MTPQEHQTLSTLLSQLTQIRGMPKDPEANAMIGQAVAQQPDAAYLLVQRAMLLEQALEAAKAQIAELQRQVDAAPSSARGGSFLDGNAWGNSAGGSAPRDAGELSATGNPLPPAGQGRYAASPAPDASAYQAAAPMAARGRGPASMFGGGGGSMLGTLAATAAGVAGGAFLFQGIGNLLGNHHAADTHAKTDTANALDSSQLADSSSAPPSPNDMPLQESGAADNNLLDDSFTDGGGFDSGDDGTYDV